MALSTIFSTRRLTHIFRALANERRMTIIKILAKESLSVGEIGNKLGITIRSVSKHLQRMEREGIIIRKREGKFVVYNLASHFRKSGIYKQILRSKK